MNNIEILTINANALFKSKTMAAIWDRMSALSLLYTIGLSIILKSSFIVLFALSEAERYCWSLLNRLVPRGISFISLGLSLIYVCLEKPLRFLMYLHEPIS